jgi:hypothetical protein
MTPPSFHAQCMDTSVNVFLCNLMVQTRSDKNDEIHVSYHDDMGATGLTVTNVCITTEDMRLASSYMITVHLLYDPPHLRTLRSCVNVLVVRYKMVCASAFFLEGRRGTRTPKHFVNLTGESKNFKMLAFALNQLQTYYGCVCDLLSFM